MVISLGKRQKAGLPWAAGGASFLFSFDLSLDVSAAVAKHVARLTALHIPQAAAAAGAGLVVEDAFVGLFGLAHRGPLWSSALSRPLRNSQLSSIA
jgi:hypothetical protein